MYKKKTDGSQKLDGSIGRGAVPPTPSPAIGRTASTRVTGERPALAEPGMNVTQIAKDPSTSSETLSSMAAGELSILSAAAIIANPNTPDSVARALADRKDFTLEGGKSPVLQRVYKERRRKQQATERVLPPARIDPGRLYSAPAGTNYMAPELDACARCGSKYCWKGCYAGEPGYVYVTGSGYVTMRQARAIADAWEAQGLIWGPHDPIRRIEVVCDDTSCSECAASRIA